jgi:hypothetical protein
MIPQFACPARFPSSNNKKPNASHETLGLCDTLTYDKQTTDGGRFTRIARTTIAKPACRHCKPLAQLY